jgi:hypothetical protein
MMRRIKLPGKPPDLFREVSGPSPRAWLSVLSALTVLGAGLLSAPAAALEFRFSTRADEILQSNTFLDEDLGLFETSQPAGSEISAPVLQPRPTLFNSDENLDAHAQLAGVHYFSLAAGATLDDDSGAFPVDDDDILRWDPVSGTASIFFDLGVVDALSFHSDGDLMVSFATPTPFEGLFLQDGDVVKFDAGDAAGTRLEFFDEDTFAPQWDMDGYHFVSDTEQYFTTFGNEALAGVTVADGDVIRWDGTTVSVVVAQSAFASSTGNFDLDALSSPEPATVCLLGAGVVGLASLGSRRGY